MAEIKVGDMVWLPTPIRDNPAKTALDEQMLGFEQELTAEPGRVVSIDSSGWVMVDRGSFGQFGHHISTLRLAQDKQPDLDLGPAIEAAAKAAYSAATFHTAPWDDLAPAARKTWLRESRTHIEAALPELEKALREKVAREIEGALRFLTWT